MKAIITRPNSDGTYDDVGMNNRTVVGPYKLLNNLIRHGTPQHFKGKGRLRYELFYGDSILPEKPDKTIYWGK